MSLEGKQIDRYHILRLIGSGGMGDVYLAEDPRIGQQVAVKVIRTERTPYPGEDEPKNAVRLFQREAKTIVKLDHAHILPLYDYGEELIGTMPIIYLVMPYRPEGSLLDWLRGRETKKLLPPQDVAHLITQAADALQHAHDQRVIHQDVKPSNFLVRLNKEAHSRPTLLLSDFGIAHLSSATSSVSQSVRGTPSYMAPEQWEGEPVPATDQYALAVMAFELLTGKLPFQGSPSQMMYQHIHTQPQPPSALNPELSREIDLIMARALAKRPSERFASITAFGQALQQAAGMPQAQIESHVPLVETVNGAMTPDSGDQAELIEPTVPNATLQVLSDESETDIKPRSIPPLVPVELAPPRQAEAGEISQHESNKPTDLPPHVPERVAASTISPHKSRKRLLVLTVLIVLAMAFIGGGIVYALPALTNNSRARGTSPAGQRTTTVSGSPVVSGATSASISIIPDFENGAKHLLD